MIVSNIVKKNIQFQLLWKILILKFDKRRVQTDHFLPPELPIFAETDTPKEELPAHPGRPEHPGEVGALGRIVALLSPLLVILPEFIWVQQIN